MRVGHLTVSDPHEGFARSSVRRRPGQHRPVDSVADVGRGVGAGRDTSIAKHPGVGRRSPVARTVAVPNDQCGRGFVEQSSKIVGRHVHRTGLINHDDSPVMRATHTEGSTMIVAHESTGIAQHRTRCCWSPPSLGAAGNAYKRHRLVDNQWRKDSGRGASTADFQRPTKGSQLVGSLGYASTRALGEQSRQHQSGGCVATRNARLIELCRAEQARLAREDREGSFAHGT